MGPDYDICGTDIGQEDKAGLVRCRGSVASVCMGYMTVPTVLGLFEGIVGT